MWILDTHQDVTPVMDARDGFWMDSVVDSGRWILDTRGFWTPIKTR